MEINISDNNKYIIYSLIAGLLTLVVFKSPMVLIAVLYIIMIYEVLYNSEDAIIFFLICSLFQNFMLIIFANNFTALETNILILVKELLVYIYFVFYIFLRRIKDRKLSTLDYIFIVFLIIAFISILKSSTSLGLRVVSLRQICIPLFCYYFGESIQISNSGYKKIIDSILGLAGIIIFAGIIIYVAPDTIWHNLGYDQFWLNKTGSAIHVSLDNFYTYDLGVRIKRFVSFTADPLATSHFLVIALILLFKYKDRFNKLFFIIYGALLVISIGLGFSKGTLIILASAIIFNIYLSLKNYRNKVIFNVMLMSSIIIFFVVINIYMNEAKVNTSTTNHIGSFLAGIQSMSLIGEGLGTAGYTTAIMGGTTAAAGAVTESFFGVLIVQMGILGTIALYSFLIFLIWRNYQFYKKNNFVEYYISMVLLTSTILESLFSSSSISMIGTGIYFILSAVCTNYGNSKVNNISNI